MRSQWRRPGAARVTGDQVDGLVSRARGDIAAVLGRVLDDEAGLARIYAMHGQQPPVQPSRAADEEDSGVQVVCDRIAMLETALTQADSPGMPSHRGGMYLGMARQFLAELRAGLASRTLTADDAFRLLTNVRHDLREADNILRSEQQLPLAKSVLTRLGELRDLTGDLALQLDTLTGQVMKLFGHADDPAAVPAPQH